MRLKCVRLAKFRSLNCLIQNDVERRDLNLRMAGQQPQGL